MLVLKNTKSYIAISIKEKEKLIFKIIFLSPSKSDQYKLIVISRVAYQMVTKDVIYKAFIN